MTPTFDCKTLWMAKKISIININDGCLIYGLPAHADLSQHRANGGQQTKTVCRMDCGKLGARGVHPACV